MCFSLRFDILYHLKHLSIVFDQPQVLHSLVNLKVQKLTSLIYLFSKAKQAKDLHQLLMHAYLLIEDAITNHNFISWLPSLYNLLIEFLCQVTNS